MKKIIERFQKEEMDENDKDQKMIENLQNEVVKECQCRPILSFDKKGKFVKEYYDSQEIISQAKKILLDAGDERFVNCPGFSYIYDNILLDVMVGNRYAHIFCYYGSDHPASKEPKGLVLKFTNRGMLLKKAIQSANIKEQEREDCPQL